MYALSRCSWMDALSRVVGLIRYGGLAGWMR